MDIWKEFIYTGCQRSGGLSPLLQKHWGYVIFMAQSGQTETWATTMAKQKEKAVVGLKNFTDVSEWPQTAMVWEWKFHAALFKLADKSVYLHTALNFWLIMAVSTPTQKK